MNDIPDVPIERSQDRGIRDRLSPIWLIPIIAVAVAITLAWQNYADRGPLIVISFDDASGIVEGETELRYRQVGVGIVERVAFSSELDRVEVLVRLDHNDLAQFIDEDASFWVVRPEVTTRGVTGLNTVLSGVFIEGVWDTDPGGFVPRQEGSTNAPLLGAGERGLVFRLRATSGASLTADTPILFKGIEVGRVGQPELLPGGAAAEAEAVVFEPYDRLITSRTRFWDASGFSFSIGAGGAQLDFSSIATLISGGVTFETLISGGEPVTTGTRFELFPDESLARSSLFTDTSGTVVNISVIFDDNVSGLSAGAPVELRGVEIGEVENVTGIVDEERFGDPQVRLLTTLAIRPSRMGLEGDADENDALDFIEQRVAEGLRARLTSASVLTGGLKIEIVPVEDAEPAVLQRDADPFPLFPTTESNVADVTASAEGVLNRISGLPIEDLMASAIGFLQAATDLVSDEELGQVPGEVTGLLRDVRDVVGSDAVQALPGQLAGVAADVQSAVTDLRTLLAEPALQGLPENVSGLIGDARGIIGSEEARALPARLDAILADLDTASDRITSILANDALDRLPQQVTAILDDVEGVTGSEAVQGLPDDVRALIGDVRTATQDISGITTQLEEARAAERLLAAVDETAAAAEAVTGSVEGVPELIESLNSVARKADSLPIEQVAEDLSAALEAAREIMASEGAKQLPASLTAALDEAEAALAELRAGGTVENVNRTLASAREAASAIERAAGQLPTLVERINRLAGQAGQTFAGYDASSEFGRTAQSALRDIQEAAKALESLAEALERRPNSIILGR